MKRYRIPAVLALIVGFMMAIWGSQLPLKQDNLVEQSTSEWILSKSLTIGGSASRYNSRVRSRAIIQKMSYLNSELIDRNEIHE